MLPNGEGLLFRHMLGKTLGNGVENFEICPVLALDAYVQEARGMGVMLSEGYLFRPVDLSQSSVLEEHMSYSVAYERLTTYLRALGIDEGETPHSLRRGCAITLSLSGAASQAEDIMRHIGWFSRGSLDRYNEFVYTCLYVGFV